MSQYSTVAEFILEDSLKSSQQRLIQDISTLNLGEVVADLALYLQRLDTVIVSLGKIREELEYLQESILEAGV